MTAVPTSSAPSPPVDRTRGGDVLPRLQLVTPELAGADADGLLAATDAALGAGARWLQVRSKHLTDAELLPTAGRLVDLARAHGATVVIDDRIDVALAVRADGVHVGADDLPVAVVRGLLGPDALVGATARTPAEARQAEADGATYLGVGPVFVSSSKTSALARPIGIPGVAEIAGAVGLPVVAISGVEVGHVADLRAAGAHGVAVIAAVYGAADVGAAVASFLDALDGRGTATSTGTQAARP